jgi:hypothetical protein
VGQADAPTFSVTTKAFKAQLSGQSVDPGGLTARLLRTDLSGGTSTLTFRNADKYAVTITASGEGIPETSVTVASGEQGNMHLSWNLGTATTALRPFTLRASFDYKSAKAVSAPLTLALLQAEDSFALAAGVGGTTIPALSPVTIDASGGRVDLTLLAADSNQLWARIDNWGTNVMHVGGTLTEAHKIYLGNESAALSDLTLLYPGFGSVLKSGTISGDSASFDLTLTGAGGYSFQADYLLNLTIRRYTQLFSKTGGNATVQAISTDLSSLSTFENLVCPTSPDAASFAVESVSEKYTPLVSNVIKGLSFTYTTTGSVSPDRTLGLPMLVSWTILKSDLQKVYTDAEITSLFALLAGRTDKVAALFEKIHIYKHFSDQAIDLTREALVAANPDQFFTVAANASTGTIVLSFRLVPMDSDSEGLAVVSDNGIGWIGIYDGDRNGTLYDPLCLAATSGSITPTPGSGGGSGGGCDAGAGVTAILLSALAPLGAILLGNRRRNR